jgi:hypothetical protein
MSVEKSPSKTPPFLIWQFSNRRKVSNYLTNQLGDITLCPRNLKLLLESHA